MNNFDKFIRDHAGMFDDEEPSANHFDRFDQRLAAFHESSVKQSPIRLWMKIAAGIVILMTLGLAIFDLAT